MTPRSESHRTPEGGEHVPVPSTVEGELVYELDGRDAIVAVSTAWGRFAKENEGETLVEARVKGRSLWEFVSDDTTRELYRQVLSRVREEGEPVRFTLRCDSPTTRRLLEMKVTPRPEGHVAFHTRVLQQEPRHTQPLLDAQTLRGNALLRMCSWCNKLEARGSWVEVEEAVALLRLFETERLPGITHGICDGCHAGMLRVLKQRRGS